jgi:hypothetical protein
MKTDKRVVFDISTGNETVIEMSEEEIAQREQEIVQLQTEIENKETKKAQALEKLNKLGLTIEELQTLGFDL